VRFKPLDKHVRKMAEYYRYYGASLLDSGCGDGSLMMLVAEGIGRARCME
jgi:cyclopropane fatty-acyl-phospholipid synthase-like methyltransferase